MTDMMAAKSIEFAMQSAALLMTATVAMLALSSASSLIHTRLSYRLKAVLSFSWTIYLMSLLSGTWFLLALLGSAATELRPGDVEATLQTQHRVLRLGSDMDGPVTLEMAPTRVIVREVQKTAEGQVFSLAKLEIPSIWQPHLRIAFTIALLTFIMATCLLVGVLSAALLHRDEPVAIARVHMAVPDTASIARNENSEAPRVRKRKHRRKTANTRNSHR